MKGCGLEITVAQDGLIGIRFDCPLQLLDLKANYLPKPSSKPVLVEWKTYSADSIVEIAPVQ